MSEAPVSYTEARRYFEEFDLDGYRVGEVVRNLGSKVLVSEIDYFSDNPEPTEKELPRKLFRSESEMVPGTRYSINQFKIDHGDEHSTSKAQDTITQVTIFGNDEKESDALHATIFSVPEEPTAKAPVMRAKILGPSIRRQPKLLVKTRKTKILKATGRRIV